MGELRSYSSEGWEALKLLILWFQKLHGLRHAAVAKAIKRNRSTVSADLKKPAANRDTERRLFEMYGAWFVPVAREKAPNPRYLRSLFREVLDDGLLDEVCPAGPQAGASGPASGAPPRGGIEIVRDPVSVGRYSGYSEDQHPIRSDPNGFPRVQGLSVLVRPSNETLTRPGADGTPQLQYGVSVSLLNIVPEYVQPGHHHPLFKLRQRGTGRQTIVIEGIVLIQDDRIVLSGRDDGQRRNLMASIYFRRESAGIYRGVRAGRAAEALHGVMLGVSNSKNHFCSLFTLFALPGGLMSKDEEASEEAMSRFRQVYQQGRSSVGVYSEDEVGALLVQLGIDDGNGEVASMLRRSRDSRILSITP
jgi:hypothetical protein